MYWIHNRLSQKCFLVINDDDYVIIEKPNKYFKVEKASLKEATEWRLMIAFELKQTLKISVKRWYNQSSCISVLI